MGAKEEIQDFLGKLGANVPLDSDSKTLLAKGLYGKLQSPDLKSLIGAMTTEMPEGDKKDVAQATVNQLPQQEQANVAKDTIGQLPVATRNEVARAITPLGVPVGPTLNKLWILIVGTFSIVLLVTVGALVVTMFKSPSADGTKPELILAIITSVIGFLAGLVSPSPVQTPGGAGAGG